MPGWSLRQSVAPVEEPITLPEAKEQLRLDVGETADDALVTELIVAARDLAEVAQNRQLVTATYVLELDRFPWQGDQWPRRNRETTRPVIVPTIILPRPKLQTVSSITYIDNDGNSQILATTEYTVDADSQPGRIYQAFDKTWPETRAQPRGVVVTFVAGWGLPSTGLPLKIPVGTKQAIRMLVADLYEARRARSEGRLVDNPTVLRLLTTDAVPEAA